MTMSIQTKILPLALAFACSAFAEQYEAESATLSGGAEKVSNASASGGAYVDQKEGDIEFKVNVATAGKYTVAIHYKAGSFKSNYINVNGESAGQVDFNEATSFTDVSTIATFKAGENTFAIKHFWGWISVDYIDVTPYESKAFAICNVPVTADATPEAIKLYNFLVNNFGKKTISGIMTGDMDSFTEGADFKTHADVNDVFTRSGKYPALVGVDLMNATGGSANTDWFKTYTNKAISIAKGVWKAGGIPAITWHWRPGDEEEFYTANGNAEKNTNFDLSKAFMTGTVTWDTLSAEYKTIISDIDKVSAIFLDMQAENIAAIFRPLHEAGGNWFWWGAKEAKHLAALYRLLYERMTATNGIKNLVWVFNPSSTSETEWNPGEAYYDVLSIDVYNNDNDHGSNSGAFDDFKIKWGTSKVLALSENGPSPDVNKMAADEAIWSWWMPWYGTWGGKYIGQTSNEVWTSNMADERIITLESMPGWDNYTEANTSTAVCTDGKIETKFNGDAEKAAGTKKEDKMLVTYTNVGADGILLNYNKIPDLTKSKTLSVDITVNGTGAENDGVWIGLAFTRNGTSDSAWTWEQSPSDGCWLEQNGGSTTCKFVIDKYLDDNKVEHPTDLDNLFAITFVTSAPGFSGTITFDNLISDDGAIVSLFDDEKGLFTVSDESKVIATVSLASASAGNLNAVYTVKRNSEMHLSVISETLSFTNPIAGKTSIDVFAMNGRHVATLYRGNLTTGTHAFSLANINRGQYIIRVKGQGLAATQPIRIK